MHKYANGLGPTSWGFWCIFLPFRERFNSPSTIHDIAYCLGTTEEDKEHADKNFLHGCLKQSRKSIIAIFFSFFYYEMVNIFGKHYFQYK